MRTFSVCFKFETNLNILFGNKILVNLLKIISDLRAKRRRKFSPRSTRARCVHLGNRFFFSFKITRFLYIFNTYKTVCFFFSLAIRINMTAYIQKRRTLRTEKKAVHIEREKQCEKHRTMISWCSVLKKRNIRAIFGLKIAAIVFTHAGNSEHIRSVYFIVWEKRCKVSRCKESVL